MNPDENFIAELKKLDGAIKYDGDASVQVMFKLANGKTLRIGITDDDVAERKGIWCDQYQGLAIKPVPYTVRKGDEYLLHTHKELIALCDKHNATCDLAASNVNLFVHHATEALRLEIAKLPYLDGARFFWDGDTLEIQ